MRQLIILSILFTCACISSQAQVNYVLNASFEQYTRCPNSVDQIRNADYWSQIDTSIIDPICSPEYCNACASPSSDVSVPSSYYYYHYPRTGNGMVQMAMYVDNRGPSGYYQRDYTQGRLYTNLTASKTYCVTFYVTLEQISQYSINHIGAYIDDGRIDEGQDSIGCAAPQTDFTPQIVEDTIINDTLNWVKVQGSYTATGNEKFITIGNFFNIEHTDTVEVHFGVESHASLYLIDDVSVIASDAVANAGPDAAVSPGSDSATIGTSDEGMPCTWYVLGSATPIGYSGSIKVHPDTTTSYVIEMDLCGNVTRDTVVVVAAPAGVGAISMKYANVQIYPNPATTSFTITHASGSELLITDVVGQQVYEAAVSSDKETIDIASLVKGVYLVQVVDITTGAKITKRVIKE